MIEFYNIIRCCVFKSNSSTRFERSQRIQCSIKIYSIFFCIFSKINNIFIVDIIFVVNFIFEFNWHIVFVQKIDFIVEKIENKQTRIVSQNVHNLLNDKT